MARLQRALGYDHVAHALAWTDGRIDEDALRERIDLLARTYPEFSSRLVERRGGRAHWTLIGGSPPIREHDLASEEDLHRFVCDLAASPMELEREGPAELHLLRMAGGDVLLLRWSHLLMDGGGFDRMLREFPRMTEGRSAVPGDPLRVYLRGVPVERRIRIAARYVRDRLVSTWRDGTKAASVVRHRSVVEGDASRARFALRELDAEGTRTVEQRAREAAGLGGLIPAIVASCFRSVAWTSDGPERDGVCRTNVPVPMWSPSAGRVPVTLNLAANLPVEATVEELEDRVALTGSIAGQIRDRLRCGFDVGQILLADWLARPVGWMALRRLAGHPRAGIAARPRTFTFSHRGTVPGDGLSFCGIGITRTHHVRLPDDGPLVVTALCGGRLQVSVSAREREDAEGTADRIADAIVEDLVSETGLGPVTTRRDGGGHSVSAISAAPPR